MRHYTAKPIALSLEPSYRLLVLLLLVSLGACALVAGVTNSVWPDSGLLGLWGLWGLWATNLAVDLLVAATAFYAIKGHALLRLPSSCRRVEVTAEGGLLLTCADGTAIEASILPSSFVASYLTVLHLKCEGSRWRRYVVIMPDGVDSEQFRQLRVWLRWGLPNQQGA